jgi:hypothetical protein
MALRMGLRSEHESDDMRQGEWRSNRRAAAVRGLLRILSNSQWAPRSAAHCATPQLDRSPNTWHTRSTSSEEAEEVSGLQEQRCFVVEELCSEGHCLSARMGDGAAALRRAAAGRWAEEGARNSKGRCPCWDGARPWESQGKQGRRSEVEEGARAHEGELLLLAELRHGQRSGDNRGEVRASSCC